MKELKDFKLKEIMYLDQIKEGLLKIEQKITIFQNIATRIFERAERAQQIYYDRVYRAIENN